jgi:hypothetical protein
MSPERDIEKLLREAARKRLEKAGAPTELHPVNRRALQEEVARQFGGKKAALRPSFLGWLGRGWPRLAVSFGLVLLIGVAAMVWIQRDSRARAKNQTLAMTESRNPQGAVPGAYEGRAKDVKSELADNKSADRSSAETETLKEQAPVTASAALGVSAPTPNQTPALAANSALPSKDASLDKAAPSLTPLATPAPAPLVAAAPPSQPGAPPVASVQDALTFGGAPKSAASPQVLMRSAERQALAQTPAMKQESATGPGLAGVAAASGGAVSTQAASQFPAIREHFVQETAQTMARSVGAVGGRSAAPILKAFDLRENDGQLTITDADGSVYIGNLLSLDAQTDAVLEWKGDTKKEGALTTVNAASPVPRSARKQATPTGDSAAFQVVSSPTNWLFQVTGTNTSLNQLVVFKGSLILTPAAQFASQSSNALSDRAAQYGFAPTATSAPRNNFQVIGRAQLGSNSPIDVNARSAPQNR